MAFVGLYFMFQVVLLTGRILLAIVTTFHQKETFSKGQNISVKKHPHIWFS